MEAFSCAAAAASLGRNCLSTLKALYSLHEKYRNARSTIAALHSEITVIGASMQYINVIFEQQTDLARNKFSDNPELEQTFAAALAGCTLVLSCLDEEVDKILVGMGPEGSKGRMGKAQLLWREDTMKDLLCTLRGQHSAIFSIIQCLQVQNIAELGTKIDQLRLVVSDNHQAVEHAVRGSPSIYRLQSERTDPANSGTNDKSHRPYSNVAPTSQDTESSIASNERVARSYKHYHATMSTFSRQSSTGIPSASWNNDESVDEAASVRGLAPSTVRASDLSRNEDVQSDRQSIISALSTSSWTLKWLESQLSPEETNKVLKRMQSTISLTPTLASDAENAIVATDVQTFIEHIRYFMPVLADFDFDLDEGIAESHGRTPRNEEVAVEASLSTQSPQSKEDVVLADGLPRQAREFFDHIAEAPFSSDDPGTNGDRPSVTNETSLSIAESSLFSAREETVSSCSELSAETRASTSGIKNSLEPEVEDKCHAKPHEPGGSTTMTVHPPLSSVDISIYVEKHSHHRGTVICTPTADKKLRARYSFSQALAPEQDRPRTDTCLLDNVNGGTLHTSLQERPLLGGRVFFVQRPTSQPVVGAAGTTSTRNPPVGPVSEISSYG